MRTTNKFNVIGVECLYYHVLLGRFWIHQHKVVLATYHHCVKVFWKGRKIHI